MSDQPRAQVAPVEPYFDHTPEPFGDGLPDPLVYDASARALRQRTVNFAAKRRADMRYVSGLDRGTAERHFRWRPAVAPGGLGFRASPDGQAELVAAHRAGDISIDMDDTDRRITIRWNDASSGESVVGSAIASRLRRDRHGAASATAIRSATDCASATGRQPRLAARRSYRNAAGAAGRPGSRVGRLFCSLDGSLRSLDLSVSCASATAISVPPIAPHRAGR